VGGGVLLSGPKEKTNPCCTKGWGKSTGGKDKGGASLGGKKGGFGRPKNEFWDEKWIILNEGRAREEMEVKALVNEKTFGRKFRLTKTGGGCVTGFDAEGLDRGGSQDLRKSRRKSKVGTEEKGTLSIRKRHWREIVGDADGDSWQKDKRRVGKPGPVGMEGKNFCQWSRGMFGEKPGTIWELASGIGEGGVPVVSVEGIAGKCRKGGNENFPLRN